MYRIIKHGINRLFLYMKLMRMGNCLFAVLSTLLGFYYFQGDFIICHALLALLAGLATFFIAAGGYVVNDYFDYKIDLINRPERPLPRGDIPLQNAKIFSFILFSMGILFGSGLALLLYKTNISVSILCFIIVLLNTTTLYLYARFYKKGFLFGNLIVSWNACSTFFFGALVNNNISNVLPLICFAFIYTLMREWVKTIEDRHGDEIENARTIAVVYGERRTWICVLISNVSLMVLVSVFYYNGFLTLGLSIFLKLAIMLPALYFGRMVRKSPPSPSHKCGGNRREKIAALIQKYMKLNMLLVVIGYIVNDIVCIRI